MLLAFSCTFLLFVFFHVSYSSLYSSVTADIGIGYGYVWRSYV